ncbi:hypothetical protein LEM8419_01300 [Neolewinella maritima]|uniref:GNAT family N-acetyltransferase n=1 Tax=Neolewinella maritima TaxID=1383882 RepID=A0ABN8F0P7_9BACT|nr:hypothetical protein [Neolewinella maritima]CAH1000153.1 hypothetical protein LEM8419_01300 [Neolewinella maritima]
MADVRYLRRSAIDTARWDAAVRSDPRPLPYGLSWWLDAVTDGQWDGLVLDDYRAVLPLPRQRRYRLLPTYGRPPFTQQLGPFGVLQAGDIDLLLQHLPRRWPVSLPLRYAPDHIAAAPSLTCRRRVNYVLDLSLLYAEVTAGFPKKLRQYSRRWATDQLEACTPKAVVTLYRNELGERAGLRDLHFRRLEKLMHEAVARNAGHCYQLRDGGNLLAAGFFPYLTGRTINLAAASTELGMRERGMSRLLFQLFRQRAGHAGAVFDFEGSELPGVREYFAKFGGVDEGYYLVERRLFGLL